MFLKMRIDGHVDPHWADWFEGLAMRHLPDGSTEFSGPVADQAAIYGLLSRARDLGMTLLSVALDGDDPAPGAASAAGN